METNEITIKVVVDECNVKHQIDIAMETIIYSEDGDNKIVWRSKDGKYKLQVWRNGNEIVINPANVDKDEKIVSTAVEIADQVDRIKPDQY
ncbi:MAG: hypothetical protein H0V01_11040 [Bacteroidetes bacterium]|nr:hypothetical protein [Bacteroidota bacterium]HET6244485.1 hypothetical protein [Bacteroidia bacterium]